MSGFFVTATNILCTLSMFWGLVVSGPIDANATQETQILFHRLQALALDPTKIIFGQQEATEYGIYGWKPPYRKEHEGGWAYTIEMSEEDDKEALCDIKSVTGDYPGLIGFNVGDLSPPHLDEIGALTRLAYARGSLITYYMSTRNPATGGSEMIEQDGGAVLHSIKQILPGGAKHDEFMGLLDDVAGFVQTLKDHNGNFIPILFRPFHENNANWYWYGQNNAANNTFEDYIKLWQFTVNYLRDTKQIHQFLYVYAPSDQYVDFHTDGNATAYLKTYPGNAYVDVMAFDGYHNVLTDDLVPTYVRHVHELVVEAGHRGKIPAIAEIGLQNNGINSNHNFWMGRILSPIKVSSVTKRLAYIMTWTNRCAEPCSIWVPYKGHSSVKDFMDFYSDNITVFSREMPTLYT